MITHLPLKSNIVLFAFALVFLSLGGCLKINQIDDTDDTNSDSEFTITASGSSWIITANGTPLHSLNSASYVNTYQAQSYKLTIPRSPALSTANTTISSQFPKAFGVTLDGVKLDPLTAECYDANGNKENAGSSCTYRQDALQTISDLGFDDYYGHVQPNFGAYHYHAYSRDAAKKIYEKFVGSAPTNNVDMVLIGLARDGFPIYYSLKNTYTSSYVMRTSTRLDFNNKILPIVANGLYVEDYRYSANHGNLDDCNGVSAAAPSDYSDYTDNGGVALDRTINYFYVLTDRFKSGSPHFPAIPHCFKGVVNNSDGF